MRYDFDNVINRKDTYASKWMVEGDAISMGIADMDFSCAPCIKEAIQQKAAFGVYGYQEVPPNYYECFQKWWREHHNTVLDTSWMLFSSGIVAAIASMIRNLTVAGDQIVILSPGYPVFYNIIQKNGRRVLPSTLSYKNHAYQINFDDLKEKLKQPQTTMMIVCNPHNPTGTIWSSDDLEQLGELCEAHHVLLISDEAHGDLTIPQKQYHPLLSLKNSCNAHSITCLSAGKSFNLAGLKAACIVIPDEHLRQRVQCACNNDELIEPNTFACEASIAACQDGFEWLLELREYLQENRRYAAKYLIEHIPGFTLIEAQATYLLWIDCSNLFPDTDAFVAYLKEMKQLYVSEGSAFGDARFIRINIACPKQQLSSALLRLKEGSEEFLQICNQEC